MSATSTSDRNRLHDLELPPGYYVDPVSGAWKSIPWPTDPDEKAALVASSLGPALIEWAESTLTDYQTGNPWRYTEGQQRFLILWYAVDERGRFVYRSGVKRGAKGTGKDPFGGSMCLLELLGPSQFSHFDDETGQPIGKRHTLPLVQIAANSEAQAKDMLRVANAMLSREVRDHYGIDAGETRTTIEGGGRLELLTASEKSSEGDPATFIALNESHHMTHTSGGQRVAAVARRNVGKSPAHIQARLCEFTNAHQQGGESVAEDSYEAWQLQVSGKSKGKRDILYDSIEAPPDVDITDPDDLMRGLRAAYSDAHWSDLERLADEAMDRRTTVADTIRFYLNGLAAAEDAWVDPRRFDSMAAPHIVVEQDTPIAMFLDCSKSEDATALVGCRISDGHVFTLGVWRKPHGHRGKDWLAPREEVDARVRDAFDRYSVDWFGVDPSPATDDADESLYWGELIDSWHRDFRRKVRLWATPGAQMGHSVKYDLRLSQTGGVKRNEAFVQEAELTQHAIDEEDSAFTHDGHPALRIHVHNAKNRSTKWGMSLGKKTRDSSDLVDLAVAMVGARLGRRIVQNSGKARRSDPTKKQGRRVVVLR